MVGLSKTYSDTDLTNFDDMDIGGANAINIANQNISTFTKPQQATQQPQQAPQQTQQAADNKPVENKDWPVYTRFDFEREVFGQDINNMLEILEYKQNIILQGSPGVGKTFTAKRLAFAMMGCKDESRILGVQFHQNYTYDDFIQGLRPTLTGGFELSNGPFYEICIKAKNDPEHRPHFIIIDEINRGNMSKILGEMFSLIEKDHRGEYMTLKFGEPFTVPTNMYIIGTMNTADRGLVMLDYALRRRFAFITVEPAFKSAGFRALLANANNLKFNKIARAILELNKEVCQDEMLGPGFQIGNSYFCIRRQVVDEDLNRIIDYEIMPLLEEYWYDSPEKVDRWRGKFEAILQRGK